MFDRPPPRLYTIASGAHFLDTLAAHLLTIADGDPLRLASIRVLLPTRRAGRALAEAFLRRSGGGAMVLPRVIPIGDVDEDELSIADAGVPSGGGAAVDMPPAIANLHRQALLARAVMALPDHKLQPEQAMGLAAELAKLLDRMTTEDCAPSALKSLVHEDYAVHWQEVLRFLEILIDHWPAILAAEGAVDPPARRNALLRAQADLWRREAPTGPIVAAGSTGSIPATAELLSVIAGLPQGAVILPGLDNQLDDAAWAALAPSHPQFGMRQLLARLDIDRRNVQSLDDQYTDTEHRDGILSAALRPAEAPEIALPDGLTIDAAMAGIQRIDCPSPSDEANVIALIMRYCLDAPGKTCALVTPDRGLARRVAAALRRWDIEIDDSAGTPLAATPTGSFLRLLIDAVHQRMAPVPLLALLKHPMAAGGLEPADFRHLVRRLDIAVLRGPRPAPWLDGLRSALGGGADTPGLSSLLDILDRVLSPLIAAVRQERTDLREILNLHVATAEALAKTADSAGTDRLWAGDAGTDAAGVISEMADALKVLGDLPASTYAPLFEKMLSGRVVRPRYGMHPRLSIWGLLEARLQHADVVILGGLNEGTWPPSPETNPWMSRPMMHAIGLEMPERRTGLTAHDFQQSFSAPEVYLTRAYRVAGTPTVPSRWLMRLENLLQRAGRPDALTQDAEGREARTWLNWALALDRTPHTPQASPRPTPPTEARPNRLSVTQIETLIRDPYSIYARHILGLSILDPLDADPGAADRGIMIHAALEEFIHAYPTDMPGNAEAKLLEIGRGVFAEHLARPGVRAFWWPRFERIATWFVDWQTSRLADGWQVLLNESFGELTIDAVEGGFTVFAKPDRIDLRPDVGLSVVDYKTGQPPSLKQVLSGLSPQLPLEAAIAATGGFDDVPATETAQLMYVQLSGGRTPGSAKALKLDVSETTERTLAGLRRLIVKFADPATPYLSRPRPQFESRFGDYDHLARVGAWGVAGGDDE